LKQLRELDIVSKIWNNLKENFSSAEIFFPEILIFSLGLFFIFALLIEYTSLGFVLITLLAVDFLILYLMGAKRNSELKNIKEIIRAIRKNRYSKPEEIKLEKNLSDLEYEIKKMFLRTQNDINNMQKLEQVRTEFLGNVSHELRTPIFAIQGYVETLLNGAIDDKNVNKNFLLKANHHTQNLNNLLNDLIDISMIESGELKMSYRYFNVNEYMTALVNEFKPMAHKKNIELILKPVDPDLQLFGDKTRLRQVMTNLISNAIKYTEEGKVEIEVVEEEKFGKIIVRDTGLGISEENLDRVFERFYRVDKDRSRAVGGTGLGLAIVKHLVEAHESKVEVKSELGKGTEFSFRLKK
jgi:two-component system phosphate regulon sensor histidine kinase PhoR